jgi:hypothetical protein
MLGFMVALKDDNVRLDDRIASALEARASAQGLSLQAYLETIALAETRPELHTITPDELDRLLDQEASRGPSPSGTFSRAEQYGDHD